MRTVRITYKKTGCMRFCSHLDITRFMTRILRRAKLPVWYTEGFNPRIYITFALPLPLGFISEHEIMDIRITDDLFDISSIPETLNSFCPGDIRFLSAKEAVSKAGDVGSADFTVRFDDGGKLLKRLGDYLAGDSLTVTKRTKHGGEKQIDVKEYLKAVSLTADTDGNTVLELNLPAGGSMNINPELLLSAFFCNVSSEYYCYTVTRTAIRDTHGNIFA